MPAFPFGPTIYFLEMRRRLERDHDCSFIPPNDRPVGKMERTIEGTTYHIYLPNSDDDPLTPSEIRNICAALKVPHEDFGVYLP